MAVYAAHLTRTLSGTPSVFQVTAQEALGSMVKPALRKVFEYLSAVYPDKFSWSVQWYDELYLLLDALLQYHYLKHYVASFSESFYGLVREPVQGGGSASAFSAGGGTRLPARVELASLVLLALAPYARGKAEAAVERWRERRDDGALGKSKSDSLRRAAIKLYSVLHLVLESLRLFQLGAYLSGRTSSPTLGLRLLGLRLKDAPPPACEDSGYGWGDLGRSLLSGNIGEATVTFPMLGASLLCALQYGAFLVQFLRWWEASAPRARAVLPTPPPPPPLTQEERSSRYKNKCALCLQPWNIPTVLPVSGYVFCYKCISRHLRTSDACPATRLPAAPDSLIRLYLE